MFYLFIWGSCGVALRLLLDLRIYGRRNVPCRGGVILAVNHQSYLDPVVVGCGLARPVHYMARRTLFRGVYGTIIGNLNAFPVELGGANRAAVREFLRRVREGKAVMLFPEGTRSPDGRLAEVRPGAGGLAVRAGVPVIPTYVDGTFQAWSRHMKLPRRAPVTITYGRPISVERRPGESKRALQKRIGMEIASHLKALEALARSRRPGPAQRHLPPRSPGTLLKTARSNGALLSAGPL